MTGYAAAVMPARAPLKMEPQDFSVAPSARQTGADRPLSGVWRLAAFVPTLLITAALCYSIALFVGRNGVGPLEAAMLTLVGLTLIWLTFSVNTACLGLLRIAFGQNRPSPAPDVHPSLDIALLVPVYNEAPWDVFGNASAMLKELTATHQPHRYSLVILSDTRDAEIAFQEERAFAALRAEHLGAIDLHYRRRAENTDKKVGNINDWIENWGAAYGAFLVLDADSLMSGAAIGQLARAMALDPGAGLIQSRPTLIGAQTLFGRVQQFSSAVYGWLLAEGLESWAQGEGNYWGHNAIIRTRAFAQSARLPYLRGPFGAKRLIRSHDFVEAGMLRRAGWSVRFLPRIGGSYEETPQSLIDYALRDRRWCHGNMQHLRLLAARGFHMISRVHLLQGALAFLMSPAWLAVVVLWSMVGAQEANAPESYFSPVNPLQPMWPEAAPNLAWFYLLFVYGMLLFPKLVGAVLIGLRRRTRVAYGSGFMFAGSALLELVLSVLYAPILMVQHSIAAVFALLGRAPSWSPQVRGSDGYSWAATLRFHWIETVLGTALLAGMVFAGVSLMILPIAISLAFAAPLSRLSTIRVADARARLFRMDTLHTLIEPRIVSMARHERASMKSFLSEDAPQVIAAE